MSIKITFGGDVAFSHHRGNIGGLVEICPDSNFLCRGYRKLSRNLKTIKRYDASKGSKNFYKNQYLGNYTPAQKITNINLEEYGGKPWKTPLKETKQFPNRNALFDHMGDIFKTADIGCVNLETPFSTNGRHLGALHSSPEYAQSLKNNNIILTSIANNHIFDSGENGFLETLKSLSQNGIHYFGGGMTIDEARAGKILEIKGLKLGFLAYTSLCNCSFISLAKKDQCGILPLYEPIVIEDIKALKTKCDFVIVAPHFDIENSSLVHKNSIEIAHTMIDSGADLIVGNHAHIPKPIEMYKGKLIIYCLGNLIFMIFSELWKHSLIAEISISDPHKIERARFYPITFNPNRNFLPHIIQNDEERSLLKNLQKSSWKKFKTKLTLNEHYLEVKP